MKTILVVDDEQEILDLTKRRLEKWGYQVITACDGEQGLERALGHKPDLILLDITMPKKNGFALLEELKKKEATRLIPVIMLSGKGETYSLREGETGGAIDYFIKPCDWDELLSYIRKYTAE